MPKQHHIISIESGTKTRVTRDLTDIYHHLQRKGAFDGQTRVYEPINEEGEQFPDESQKVQKNADSLLRGAAKILTELFDVVATKDTGNMTARADVLVDDKPLLKDVPATHLLFLEKQLKDIQTVWRTLPTLDPAYEWQRDEAGGYRAKPVKTTKTQKVAEPIVLYNATPEHPAQTQLVSVDKTVGHWNTTKLSGALSADRKKQLLDRVAVLINAVKTARTTANLVDVEHQEVGEKIFDYLLK